LPEPDGLRAGTGTLRGQAAVDLVALAGGSTEDDVLGPERALEHSGLYAAVFLILVGGSLLLQGRPGVVHSDGGGTIHTVIEALGTILAFIVGALSLVRYYSRKQATFLLIGCGFLGAAILDLNHVIGTTPWIVWRRTWGDVEAEAALYAWTWTAGRVFLSVFLFMSLLAWRQEVRESREEVMSEIPVYLTALALTIANLLFFDLAELPLLARLGSVWRPGEAVPAIFFLLALVGFYRKGRWRRDEFEHWLLVSLIVAMMVDGAYMAFSRQLSDAMFLAAHLLKVVSYLAILVGLLTSVHATFTREALVLGALTKSNDALAREVDFRAKTERAVKETSERLQRFLDNANDLIQSVAPDGRFLYVNTAWKRSLGYSDDDLDRMTLFQVVHPAHRPALEAELRRVLDGGEPRRFNTEYVAADGRLVILSGSTQAQIVGDRAVATQSILRDVTEQRLAERRLDESQRNLEALVENTGDSIWSVDRDHRLITLNSAFSLAVEARTNREPRAGLLPSEVFPDAADAQWYRELYDRTLAGERHVAVRSDYVDGRLRYFELYANPIHSMEGVSGAVFFGKDVTQRVRAEEALQMAKDEAEAANKAKSDFLASMSHELRTPLNSVIGFTNVLRKNKDGRLDEKDLGFLNRVLSNGKHLLALINEVLDLAKVEAGRMELIIEEVDLAHLCVETVQQLEGQARAKDGAVRLQADMPDDVAPVATDSAKLKQVIINLVGNALKFTHEGSVTVRLEVASDGRTPTAIAVEDTGIGIPADRLGAIFEAFQQAEAGTSRKYGGTGLGLALSRSICLLMGYDLIVESREGKGSTFRIVMGQRVERAVRPAESDAGHVPKAVGQAEAPPPVASGAGVPKVGEPARKKRTDDQRHPPAPRPTWADFKVLVVDDDADSRVLISHFLEDFGCQVFTAASGEEGLRLAREHSPDLMTLDLIMPGVTGWELLKHMKSDPALRAIPVVVISVVANEGRGKLLGAVDLITKPFEREDLLRVLWRNLGRQRGGRVMIMMADEASRNAMEAVVRACGLEPSVCEGGDLMARIRQLGPDAVVMDLEVDGLPGLPSLLELRADRLHTGLPALVVTHGALNEKERQIIGDLATLHTDLAGAPEALRKLLVASFPLAASGKEA